MIASCAELSTLPHLDEGTDLSIRPSGQRHLQHYTLSRPQRGRPQSPPPCGAPGATSTFLRLFRTGPRFALPSAEPSGA